MSTVTVKQVSTRPYPFELKSSLSWGRGHQLQSLQHVLVTIELSDGAIGIAEAPPRPTIYGETPESITAIIEREFTGMLVGQPLNNEDDIHTLYQQLSLIKNNNTARGAIDLALHMALTRSQGRTLSDLLEVDLDSVRVSFILGTGTTQDVMDEVRWAFEQGVRVLKVKVGKDFEREAEQISHIKDEYGHRLDVYVDANQCYTAENAVQHLQAFREMGVLWCEEPLIVTQMRNRETLHPQAPMPLIGDDSAFTLADLRREVNFDTFDILNIKTARTGFTESGAMLDAARAAAKGVMVGSQASTGLGTLHAAAFSALGGIDHPCELSFWLKLREDILDRPLQLHDGYLELAGIAATRLDPARLAAAAV